ncbi:hypothetical protein [Rugosimonospora africana]|uniref:Uncharacterized protein n=1 Tax=Rugosimonospora africana TaxID=556532 RepID=A0A8J3QUG7_9ACTN|nr:hypothetical protein [Rugosimonospora africana]GIH16307.1 hypothetical protein Raf01_44790 [Rugosimonospora africana]
MTDAVGEPVGLGRAGAVVDGVARGVGLADGVADGVRIGALGVAGGRVVGGAGRVGCTAWVGGGAGCWYAAFGAGAGRTSRYVASVARKNSTSATVDLRTFQWLGDLQRLMTDPPPSPSPVQC